MSRWLYHLVPRELWDGRNEGDERGGSASRAEAGEPYSPVSFARGGSVHCPYRDAVTESARLYFAVGAKLVVLRIDPRELDVPLRVAETPRGPMPHVHGAIPRAAIAASFPFSPEEMARAPDALDDPR